MPFNLPLVGPAYLYKNPMVALSVCYGIKCVYVLKQNVFDQHWYSLFRSTSYFFPAYKSPQIKATPFISPPKTPFEGVF